MGNDYKEKINALKKKYNVDIIYSWSKYKLYRDESYSFLLKYILHEKEDMPQGLYSVSGTVCHEILEKLYLGKIKYQDMIVLYEEALVDFFMKRLKYDRTNEEKNKLIGKRYEDSIKLFFKQHRQIIQKVKTETYMLTFIGDYLFQGYIDAYHFDGKYHVITDWKTSSIYKDEKIEKEKGQLLIYAIALINRGVKLDTIKVRWNFLKYVDVSIAQINGKTRQSTFLRCELGEKLYSSVKTWMNKLGYSEEEFETYIKLLMQQNDITCLPNDIQAKYKVSDCYVYVKFDSKLLNEFQIDVITDLQQADLKIKEYKATKNDRIFWQEVTNEGAYFHSNLSGYSKRKHKPYAEYLEKFRSDQVRISGENELIKELFGG